MYSATNHFGSGANRVVAAIWFTLSILMAVSSVAVLFTPGKFLMPAIFLIATVIFLVGCQRTAKFKMPDQKFNRVLRNIALAAVFASVFSIFLASINA